MAGSKKEIKITAPPKEWHNIPLYQQEKRHKHFGPLASPIIFRENEFWRFNLKCQMEITQNC